MSAHKYYFLLVTMLFSIFVTTKVVAQDICPNREVSTFQTCANPDETPYNFYLPFLNLNDARFKLQYGKFKELENGTATLSGDLINVLDDQIQFALNITFNGRSNQLQNPRTHNCLTNVDNSNFYAYTSFHGKLLGNYKMAGSKANITSNGNIIQLGYGANWMDKEFSFGAATNLMVLITANPSNHPILTVIGRGQKPIACNFGLRLTDCNPCALLGGDTDGDGICDDNDCEAEDENFPAEPGTECDDGDDETVNDVISEDGCSCIGEIAENTDITSEVCTFRTAFNTTLCQGNFEGINYGGYLLLDGLGRHYSLVNGQFTEYKDGTARLIGEWVNIDNNEIKFQVDVTLTGRTASTPPNSPKEHWCLETDESNFYYYTQTKGSLIGKEAIEGAHIMIGRAGPAFQFGVGANPTNAELTFGGAGWLTATIVNQPSTGIELTLLTSPKGSNGDININLSGDPMVCVDNRGLITPNCAEDITVTAAPGANSKIVTWNTPTVSSDCIFNANSSCENAPSDLNGFSSAGSLNGSKYFISNSSNYTYAQANSIAIQNGGHLAVISSQEENDFLASQLNQDVVWIGYNDEANEGTFIWANGAAAEYTNWYGSEPNNGHNTSAFTGANHTVLRKSNGQWLDRNGQAQYAFILEIPCTGTMPAGTAPMIQTQGLAAGAAFPIGETTIVYTGKDDCGNVTTCSFKVTVKASLVTDPCAGDKSPQVTVDVVAADCDLDNGKIVFSFNDRSGRSNIEFSLDGGQTYPLNVKDKLGTATFNNLGVGNYDLWVRWGNNECPVDLGSVTLNEITKTPNESCDDKDDSTENDVIQADGCTCLGELINDADGGCDDLLANPSFENGLSPWKFNSNTRYNRNTKYRADGNYMIWIYKRYSYKKDAVIYQDAVALPGAKYAFSFYAGTHRPSYNHEVAIEFYNKYGAKLKRKAVQIDFDVDYGTVLKQYQLTETAPAGTTKIRFIGTANGGYLKLDAICVQVDKSNAQTSGRVAADEIEEGPELEETHVLYAGSDAVTLGSRIKDEGVQLDWFPKNTNLPSKFIVEKSLDGQLFEQIDEVMVEDNEDLSILDEAPDFGTNYYRVIQRFETGQEIVSNTREEKYLIDPASITIYPNPVSDNLNLRIGHFQSIEGTVRIFSPVGQQVFERAIEKEEKHISVNVSEYKNGMYFLLIEAKNRRPIERQIIVENLE